MLLYKKSLSNSIVDYSPIAKALCTLDASTQAAVSRKFEITYMMCKVGLALKEMSALCELEEKHGVNLGTGYKNEIACAKFVSYILKAELEKLTCVLSKAKFFVSRLTPQRIVKTLKMSFTW